MQNTAVQCVNQVIPNVLEHSEHSFKSLQKLDYLTYLETFDRLFDISKDKKTHEYKRYAQKFWFTWCPYLGYQDSK